MSLVRLVAARGVVVVARAVAHALAAAVGAAVRAERVCAARARLGGPGVEARCAVPACACCWCRCRCWCWCRACCVRERQERAQTRETLLLGLGRVEREHEALLGCLEPQHVCRSRAALGVAVGHVRDARPVEAVALDHAVLDAIPKPCFCVPSSCRCCCCCRCRCCWCRGRC